MVARPLGGADELTSGPNNQKRPRARAGLASSLTPQACQLLGVAPGGLRHGQRWSDLPFAGREPGNKGWAGWVPAVRPRSPGVTLTSSRVAASCSRTQRITEHDRRGHQARLGLARPARSSRWEGPRLG